MPWLILLHVPNVPDGPAGSTLGTYADQAGKSRAPARAVQPGTTATGRGEGATALWPGMQRARGLNAPQLQRLEALPDRPENSGGLRAFRPGRNRVQDDAESVSPARG